MNRLPDRDARQWQRLRQLRVQRAREALARALAEEGQARAAVQQRELRIADSRQRQQDLAWHWGGPGSADMPRWCAQLQAHREALAERLERDEYALIDEQEALDQALDSVRQRRAELLRAQAREAAVDATLKEQRREAALAADRQAELETEDARRALH